MDDGPDSPPRPQKIKSYIKPNSGYHTKTNIIKKRNVRAKMDHSNLSTFRPADIKAPKASGRFSLSKPEPSTQINSSKLQSDLDEAQRKLGKANSMIEEHKKTVATLSFELNSMKEKWEKEAEEKQAAETAKAKLLAENSSLADLVEKKTAECQAASVRNLPSTEAEQKIQKLEADLREKTAEYLIAQERGNENALTATKLMAEKIELARQLEEQQEKAERDFAVRNQKNLDTMKAMDDRISSLIKEIETLKFAAELQKRAASKTKSENECELDALRAENRQLKAELELERENAATAADLRIAPLEEQIKSLKTDLEAAHVKLADEECKRKEMRASVTEREAVTNKVLVAHCRRITVLNGFKELLVRMYKEEEFRKITEKLRKNIKNLAPQTSIPGDGVTFAAEEPVNVAMPTPPLSEDNALSTELPSDQIPPANATCPSPPPTRQPAKRSTPPSSPHADVSAIKRIKYEQVHEEDEVQIIGEKRANRSTKATALPKVEEPQPIEVNVNEAAMINPNFVAHQPPPLNMMSNMAAGHAQMFTTPQGQQLQFICNQQVMNRVPLNQMPQSANAGYRHLPSSYPMQQMQQSRAEMEEWVTVVHGCLSSRCTALELSNFLQRAFHTQKHNYDVARVALQIPGFANNFMHTYTNSMEPAFCRLRDEIRHLASTEMAPFFSINAQQQPQQTPNVPQLNFGNHGPSNAQAAPAPAAPARRGRRPKANPVPDEISFMPSLGSHMQGMNMTPQMPMQVPSAHMNQNVRPMSSRMVGPISDARQTYSNCVPTPVHRF